MTPPQPHPLDYDWRYDEVTTRSLLAIVRNLQPVLALGAPTVARRLEEIGCEVLLVDRQPAQGVRNHVICAVEQYQPKAAFGCAIVDPPWYSRQLEDWARIAGRAVRKGGTVLLSVWPADVRPDGAAELTGLFDRLAEWATIHRNVATLSYVEPAFETVARDTGRDRSFSRSPLRGELVRLDVQSVPPPLPCASPGPLWHRFILNECQLAVRLDPPSSFSGIRPVPNAEGWRWPYVSARAPGISDISIWSSYGEVGDVGDAKAVIDTLRAAFACTDAASFDQALAGLPALLTWRLPRPPYWRSFEWQHRQ